MLRARLPADGRQQHLGGSHTEGEAQRAVAIVRIEPIVRGAEDLPGGDEDGLVSGAGYLEEDLVLALELDLLVVDAPGQEHQTVHVDQVRLGQRLGGPGPEWSARRHGTKIVRYSPP
jgi:hypothetical protein